MMPSCWQLFNDDEGLSTADSAILWSSSDGENPGIDGTFPVFLEKRIGVRPVCARIFVDAMRIHPAKLPQD
jgi:hypothetical protein